MTFPAVPLVNPWSVGYVNATTLYNNTTLPLNEIQAVLANQGTGTVGHSVVPSNITGITTTNTYLTVGVTMVAGRKYLGIAQFEGLQNTATGVVNVSIGPPAGAGFNMLFTGIAANTTVYGAASQLYTPGTTGLGNWVCVASTSAGTLTIYSQSHLTILDVGTV